MQKNERPRADTSGAEQTVLNPEQTVQDHEQTFQNQEQHCQEKTVQKPRPYIAIADQKQAVHGRR